MVFTRNRRRGCSDRVPRPSDTSEYLVLVFRCDQHRDIHLVIHCREVVHGVRAERVLPGDGSVRLVRVGIPPCNAAGLSGGYLAIATPFCGDCMCHPDRIDKRLFFATVQRCRVSVYRFDDHLVRVLGDVSGGAKGT